MTVKTRKVIKILSIVLIVILVLYIGAVAFLKSGEASLRQGLSFDGSDMLNADEVPDISYNGKNYFYNKNLINVLFISVDKEKIDTEIENQVNALFLLSVDTENDKVNILPIPCNTVADVDVYDTNGNFVATESRQIGLAYGYGMDDDNSANLSCRAVSRFLYNVPMNAYCTVYTETLVEMVDTIGGVEVTLVEDMTSTDISWTKGAKVTLDSKKALEFLRFGDKSSAGRTNRQSVFLEAFAMNARAAMFKDLSLPLKVLNKFKNGMITSMNSTSLSYLVSEVIAAQFVFNNIKGNSSFKDRVEVFSPDYTALYETVLELFYEERN